MIPKEHSEFENSISSLVGLSLSLHQINKTLEAKCGLSVVQWSFLKTLIGMPAVSPHLLAKALGVSPSTLSQSLNRLAKKDLLFMRDDPSDARKKMISITRLGKESLEVADIEYKKVFSEINSIQNELRKIGEFLVQKVKVRLGETIDFDSENDVIGETQDKDL